MFGQSQTFLLTKDRRQHLEEKESLVGYRERYSVKLMPKSLNARVAPPQSILETAESKNCKGVPLLYLYTSPSEFTLFDTFTVFAFGSAVESIFLVTRAMIITLLDFNYMMKSTVVAMVLYIAAMVVACVVEPFAKQAISFWIAIYIPQLVLLLLFIGRLHTLFRRMVKGEVKGALRSRFKLKTTSVAANPNSDCLASF